MNFIETNHFTVWMASLKDWKVKSIILKRLLRVQEGLLGDVKSVGDGVFEIRIHYGQGIRIYYKQQGNEIIILLCGGDKSSQERDIAKAKQLANEY